jgi:hypothetical protein
MLLELKRPAAGLVSWQGLKPPVDSQRLAGAEEPMEASVVTGGELCRSWQELTTACRRLAGAEVGV